jgi:hypothetical protein
LKNTLPSLGWLAETSCSKISTSPAVSSDLRLNIEQSSLGLLSYHIVSIFCTTGCPAEALPALLPAEREQRPEAAVTSGSTVSDPIKASRTLTTQQLS